MLVLNHLAELLPALSHPHPLPLFNLQPVRLVAIRARSFCLLRVDKSGGAPLLGCNFIQFGGALSVQFVN